MTWLPQSVNEYGTPVSVGICDGQPDYCGREFTVCPAMDDERQERWGHGCLADFCASYDLGRDIDMFFEPLADHGLIQRRSA